MLDTLALQQHTHRIGRHAPTRDGTVRRGSKTGTNDGIVSDVGFIRSPRGTLLLAVFCRGLADGLAGELAGEDCMADLARLAMEISAISGSEQ